MKLKKGITLSTKIILSIFAIAAIIIGLKFFGIFTDRVVFQNSYQKQSGLNKSLSVYKSQLMLINGKLQNPNLSEQERADLESQKDYLTVQINSLKLEKNSNF